jgi:hypothetical protein
VSTRLAPFAAFALVSSVALTARGDERNFALEWSAPSGCPSREQMEERIARLVGEGKRARETVRARALVVSDAAGTLRADLELSTSGQPSTRHVEGDSCAAVSDAIVLIIAVAIDPEALAAPAPAHEPTPPPPAAEAPRSAAPVPERHPFFASASARFDVASLPAPAFGGELAVGFNPRHVDVEVGAALLASARATLDARPNEGADIRLIDLGARGCYEVLDASFDIGPCAGLHARWMSAHGFGSDTPADATAVFGVATLGALAKARLSARLTLRLSTEAGLPLSRPSFLIDTAGTVYQAPKAALRIALGAALHF